jgi:hypothetical protein
LNVATCTLDTAAVWTVGDGEAVSLDAVFDAVGLTAEERHIVAAGLGRSLDDLATDEELRKPDGTCYTRQRIHQLVGRAYRKLGLDPSITRGDFQESDRLDRAIALRERSRHTRPGDVMNTDDATVRRISPRERDDRKRERQLDHLTARLLREAERQGGALSDERRAHYERAYSSISQRQDG